MMKGDIVNWDTALFDTVNMTSRIQSVESICIPPRPGHVVLPEIRNFTSHKAICQKLRGRASVIYDKNTQDWMGNQLKNYPICGDFVAG